MPARPAATGLEPYRAAQEAARLRAEARHLARCDRGRSDAARRRLVELEAMACRREADSDMGFAMRRGMAGHHATA